MNSNSLQISDISTSSLDSAATTPISFIASAISKISSYLVRSEAEKAQASYRMKRETQSAAHTDMVRGLPVEEKLRLGMYRFMD